MEHETSKEKNKVQLNNVCRNIELYAMPWKQEFWSTSTSMPRYHCLDATTLLFGCHDIEAKKN